jgi:hypothetical protein
MLIGSIALYACRRWSFHSCQMYSSTPMMFITAQVQIAHADACVSVCRTTGLRCSEPFRRGSHSQERAFHMAMPSGNLAPQHWHQLKIQGFAKIDSSDRRREELSAGVEVRGKSRDTRHNCRGKPNSCMALHLPGHHEMITSVPHILLHKASKTIPLSHSRRLCETPSQG